MHDINSDLVASNACLTTHVLDTMSGKPGEGIKITLCRNENFVLTPLKARMTNVDGRLASPLMTTDETVPGEYSLIFETSSPFFKSVQIDFHITDCASHYHVPLVISPFAFSTYRGVPPHRIPIDDPKRLSSLTNPAVGTAALPGIGGAGITTHAIDIARGVGAGGLHVSLTGPEGEKINDLVTNEEGRTPEWLAGAGSLVIGEYELVFDLGTYFSACGFPVGTTPFFPHARIRFCVSDIKQHYHIPLLAAPWGYSCYCGS